MNPQIEALRQQLQQLKQLHESGDLAQARYDERRAPLERQLVDAVTGAAATPATAAAAPAPVAAASAARPSGALLGGLSVLVLAVALAGYWWTGSPRLITNPPQAASAEAAGDAHQQGQMPSPEQISAMVDKLAQRLKEKPDDVQGWTMLARAYAVLGRSAEAVPAYEKAVALRPDDADLLADYADAMAVQNGRQLNGPPLKLVTRALEIDSNNLKALALAGTAAFDRKEFAAAVAYWEKLRLGVPGGDSAYLAQVQAGIDEARQLGKLPPSPAPLPVATSTPAKPDTTAQAPAGAGTGGASVSGSVTLAAALAAQAGPEDTVFIYARAAEGSRMPLAVLRKKVKDLPLDFKLDDSMAMSPAAKLSGASQVIVAARISKSGDAIPQNGDLTGQSAPIAPGATGLKIEISELIKK